VKVNSDVRPAEFRAEDGEVLRVRPSNMGEPFRSGLSVELDGEHTWASLFIEHQEVRALSRFLSEYLNEKQEK